MKTSTLVLLLLVLTGCQSYGAARTAVHEGGAQAMDEALDVSVVIMCSDVSVGAAIRRFGTSDELWRHWLAICGRGGAILERPVP